MEKSLKFSIDIFDLKNANLNSLFGHAGINFLKASNKIETLIKELKFKKGYFNFICNYNSNTKNFEIFIKTINFSFCIKQFLFYFYNKNNLKKNNYKNENFFIETILILKYKINNKFIFDKKNFYILYLFFLNLKNYDFNNLKKKQINYHLFNLNLLKNFLKNKNLC
jgi:hypothetical protein